MKKVFALILALVMILGLATTAFAAEDGYTLTINNNVSGHTYQAYQVFDGTLDAATGILSNITWGSGISDGDALIAKLKSDAYEIKGNGVTTTLKDEFAACTTAAQIAEEMSTWSVDGDRLDRFAEIVGANEGGFLSTTYKETSAVPYTITGLDAGYYLIKDKAGTQDGKHSYNTKFILAVVKNTSVDIKGNIPTVDKLVGSSLEGSFYKAITEQINREWHYYEWIGYLPTDLNEYDNYYYQFVDIMTPGLTFHAIDQIYIEKSDNTKIWIYDTTNAEHNNPAMYPTLFVDASNPGLPYSVTTAQDGTTIKLGWSDLKAVYSALAPSDEIVIKYSAKLNEKAIVGGEGNPNEVYIIYDNNPSDVGKGESVPSEARVYTFKVKLNKVDADSKVETDGVVSYTKYLQGAQFVLYHKHNETPVYAIVDANGIVTGWDEDIEKASKLTTDATGVVQVTGLKAKLDYYLKEYKAPDTYNALFTDVHLNLVAGFDVTDPLKITSLTYQMDGYDGVGITKDGMIEITVENSQGHTLPSTGGIGTTIFYILGGVLAVGAVVLLITKKRMASAE